MKALSKAVMWRTGVACAKAWGGRTIPTSFEGQLGGHGAEGSEEKRMEGRAWDLTIEYGLASHLGTCFSLSPLEVIASGF